MTKARRIGKRSDLYGATNQDEIPGASGGRMIAVVLGDCKAFRFLIVAL